MLPESPEMLDLLNTPDTELPADFLAQESQARVGAKVPVLAFEEMAPLKALEVIKGGKATATFHDGSTHEGYIALSEQG